MSAQTFLPAPRFDGRLRLDFDESLSADSKHAGDDAPDDASIVRGSDEPAVCIRSLVVPKFA